MFLRTLTVATLLTAAAAAQTGKDNVTFDLQVNGKTIGKDVYKLKKEKQGYSLSSRYSYHAAGAEFDTSDDFKLSDDFVYLDGGASSVATQTRYSFTPNKTRTVLTIGTVQAGVQVGASMNIKPDFTVMPNYDAGAAQAFLLEAMTKPLEGGKYNIVVPGAGSAAPPPGAAGTEDDPSRPATRVQAGNVDYDAGWNKGADATGMLDGKPVKLHSYFLASGKNRWLFHFDDTNSLMQLDNSMVHASYIRQKFKLDPVAP